MTVLGSFKGDGFIGGWWNDHHFLLKPSVVIHGHFSSHNKLKSLHAFIWSRERYQNSLDNKIHKITFQKYFPAGFERKMYGADMASPDY